MFSKLADNWSEKMCVYLEQPEKKDTYALGISALLFYSITLGFIVLLSVLLHTLPATLLILLVFGVFRQFGGGAHLQEMLHCTIVTNVFIVGSSFLVTRGYLNNFITLLFIGAIVFNIVALVRWVPAGTEKKPLTDPDLRKRMWQKTLIAFISWSFIIVMCLYWQQPFYALTLLAGNIMAIFLLCPWGYTLLRILHKSFSLMKMEKINIRSKG